MRRRNEDGLFVIWTLGLALAVIFVGILMVDFWNFFSVRQDLNSLADGAAVAGTQEVDTNYFSANGKVVLLTVDSAGNFDDSIVRSAVCNYLKANGPDNDCNNPTTKIDLVADPRVPGRYNGVKVSLERDVSFMALRFLPSESGSFTDASTVSASATARSQQLDP
jgi:uncharacterized membrane protein